MPSLVCPSGHTTYYRNTKGSHSSGSPCPVPGCGEPRSAPTAKRCNRLIRYRSTSWGGEERIRRGRCKVEPKGHPGPCSVAPGYAGYELVEDAPSNVGGTDG